MERAQIQKTDGSVMSAHVIPIKYDDFLRTYKNPFRGCSNKRVLRLDTGESGDYLGIKLFVDSNYVLEEYNISFLRKPRPIIIEWSDAPQGLTIDGKPASAESKCELDSILHNTILLRAVQLAKAAWQSK